LSVSGAADDLSGEWRGIFNYPAGAPPTEFVASLVDAGGTLTGTTVEPSLQSGAVTARIDGRRTGSAVTFMKLYDRHDEGTYDSVAYRGAVDTEGLEITGRWSIPGDWSGTFIMVRESGVVADAEAEAGETIR
jgi:hypothetical protein